MIVPTRRDMLLGAPAAIGLAAVPFAEWRAARAQAVRVRRNVASADAATDLDTYRRGVAAMRALPISDPRNWQTFGGIHGNRCQHAQWWFLPWHRIWLLRFEEIVGQLTDTPGFALPYWNQFAQRRLPEPFRTPTTGNALYTSRRSASANNGTSMPLSTADPRPALARTAFVSTSSVTGFGGPQVGAPTTRGPAYGRLETAPHNTVHNWVGGSAGWMSSVRDAPRDPVFWLHHCNADRLWEAWLQQGGGRANPASSAWRDLAFAFPGATGANVTARVGDVLDPGALGYAYDDTPVPAAATATLMAAAAGPGMPVETVDATSGEARNVALGGGRVKKIRLPRAPGTVVVEGLSGNPRGAVFAVYANLPEGVPPDTEASAPYLVGHIAPFGIGEPVAHGHGATSFRFEVDPSLLGGAPELVLTIVPDPTSETRNVNVGRIRLVRE
jgi:hypothetical protein